MTCDCNHLTDFAIGVLIPTVVTLDTIDFTNLTIENLIKYPTASIAVILAMGIYLLLLPIALLQDARKTRIRLRRLSSQGHKNIPRFDSVEWRRSSSASEVQLVSPVTRQASIAEQPPPMEESETPERSQQEPAEEKSPLDERPRLQISAGQRSLQNVIAEYGRLRDSDLSGSGYELSGVEMSSRMSSVNPIIFDLGNRGGTSSRNGKRFPKDQCFSFRHLWR